MADEVTTWDKITNGMTRLQPMHDRMDATRELIHMDPLYQLKDSDGNVLSGVVNVTGNKAIVFGNTIYQDLLRAQWQTVVEGVTGNQAHAIEEFIDYNLDQADEYIFQKYRMVGLYDWLCDQVCNTGPIGAEWCPVIEGDKYSIHCLPLDMRYTAYHPTMQWVAPILSLTKDELEEHAGKLVPGYKYTGAAASSEIEVRDYWDGEKHELWVDKQSVFSEPNPFGKPPFVIVIPSVGFQTRDTGYIKYEGEDIYFLIRQIIPEMNRTLSIEQSLIYNVLRPGYEREQDNPDGSPAKPIPESGEVINIKQGQRAQPVPTGEFNRANISAKQDIQRMMDEGAPIAPRLYTTPPSGAELVAEMEALSRLQNSRIVALQVFKEQLARLMIDQYITLAKDSLDIGKRGKRKSYSVAVLKDPDTYTISYRGKMTNKRMELANLAMFSAAYDRLPLKYNLQNILMADDPDGIIREMELQEIRKADPVLDLYLKARAAAIQAADIDDESESDALKLQSKRLMDTVERMVNQERQPAQIPEKQAASPKGGNQALQMMGAAMGEGMPGMPKAPEEGM